jgi:hypothetical protein
VHEKFVQSLFGGWVQGGDNLGSCTQTGQAILDIAEGRITSRSTGRFGPMAIDPCCPRYLGCVVRSVQHA